MQTHVENQVLIKADAVKPKCCYPNKLHSWTIVQCLEEFSCLVPTVMNPLVIVDSDAVLMAQTYELFP